MSEIPDPANHLSEHRLEPSLTSPEKESLKQPLWHVLVLTILTCTAYLFYWFYKNWRDLSQQAASSQHQDTQAGLQPICAFNNISPLLRTLGLLVPIFNIYLSLTQIKGIAEIHPDLHSYPRRHPLVASGLVVGFIIAFQFLANLPRPFFLFSFLVGLPLTVAQSWLNAYWSSVEPAHLPTRQAFTFKEMAAIIAGSLVLGFTIAGMMLMPGT